MPAKLVEAYLERIGLSLAPAADLATLRAIHAAHVAAIPFENLDPFLGRPVALDLAALRAKLVERRRGGYCFEHNLLLRQVLEDIGFSVTGLAGRVRWMSQPQAPMSARTHALLMVDLAEGQFLVDVGFGVHLQDAPLRLAESGEQHTAAAVYRVEVTDGSHALRVRQPEGWRTAYLFTLEAQHPVDYDMANWFTSTWPQALFRKSLLAERLTPRERWRLHDRRLIVQPHHGPAREQVIGDAAQLVEVLRRHFLIEPPVKAEALWRRLARE